MSHNLHSDWAAAAVAQYFMAHPADCFASTSLPSQLSVFAAREARVAWPLADGVITLEADGATFQFAFEFKRHNEGIHGLLTALGQAQAYLHKRYSGVAIVIPDSYPTLEHPGPYLKNVLDCVGSNQSVGVFTYQDADPTQISPYSGKIVCHRRTKLELSASSVISSKSITSASASRQWMHVREGSTVPSAFYRYLQLAKQLPFAGTSEPNITFPAGLTNAISRRNPGVDPIKYLSNSVGDRFHDVVWRHFWFEYVFTPSVIPIWSAHVTGHYSINDAYLRLERADGAGLMMFFSGRSDSIKNQLIAQLNSRTISEDDAWERYALKVRNRAHSFREDIDSGLAHLSMLDLDGKPTDLGYKFVDACDRIGNPNIGTAKRLLGAALLQNGQLATFLHYIFRLSEEEFNNEPLQFTSTNGAGIIELNNASYLSWLEDRLANDLRVMRKVSMRGGTARKPFQAELSLLANYGFIANDLRFRLGVGLVINWPSVHEAMKISL